MSYCVIGAFFGIFLPRPTGDQSLSAIGFLLESWHFCAQFLGMATKARGKDVVQVKNSITGRYVKIDRKAGKIVGHKKSSGPYKGVPVARKRTKK